MIITDRVELCAIWGDHYSPDKMKFTIIVQNPTELDSIMDWVTINYSYPLGYEHAEGQLDWEEEFEEDEEAYHYAIEDSAFYYTRLWTAEDNEDPYSEEVINWEY